MLEVSARTGFQRTPNGSANKSAVPANVPSGPNRLPVHEADHLRPRGHAEIFAHVAGVCSPTTSSVALLPTEIADPCRAVGHMPVRASKR